MKIKLLTGLTLLVASSISAAVPNPASQDWVLKQISLALQGSASVLTAADWTAACSTGSPSSSTGCFGNVDSVAFTTLSNRLGGYETYANINPTVTPSGNLNGVFIKSFFASTNTPLDNQDINVTVTGTGVAARCVLFTQQGLGINAAEGIGDSVPGDGNSNMVGPDAPHVNTINNSSSTIRYSADNTSIVNPPTPIYMLCVGVDLSPANPNGGTVSLNGKITAV